MERCLDEAGAGWIEFAWKRGGDGWVDWARIESHEAEGAKEDPYIPSPFPAMMDMMEGPLCILFPEEES